MKRTWILVVLACVGGFSAYRYVTTRPIQVSDVIAQGYATVSIVALSATSANVIVHRTDNAPTHFVVSIPAGTYLTDSSPGSQRMVTANSLLLAVSSQQPDASARVNLYCLNEFAVPPVRNASLALAATPAGSETISQLIACLEAQDVSLPEKQLAVWLVAGNYLNQSYSSVETALSGSYRAELSREVAREFDNGMLQHEVQAQLTDMSAQRVSYALALYRATRLSSALNQQAQQMTSKTLSGFVSDSTTELTNCGYDTTQLAFFKTAPSD